jgi:hypothetical protein
VQYRVSPALETKRGKESMRVEDEVLAVLSRAETNGNALTLTGRLDRKMYERTNKVLEAAGGKWNRKAKAQRNRLPPLVPTGGG